MKMKILMCVAIVVGFCILEVNKTKASGNSINKLENIVKIKVDKTKSAYLSGENITLAVAVANFSDKSIYIPVSDPQVFNLYFRIRDSNGVIINNKAMDDPNTTLPSHYYMKNKGKDIIVFPVLEIKEKELILTIIPNALNNYIKELFPGRYYMESSGFPIMLEAKDVISRPNYPNWLWVESTNNTILIKHEPIEIVIEENDDKDQQ